MITYSLGPPPLGGAPRRSIPNDLRSISFEVHYSMTLLPEVPMRARSLIHGWVFLKSYEEYSSGENRAEIRKLITRYRLERRIRCSNLGAVKTHRLLYQQGGPRKMRPYIKKGVKIGTSRLKPSALRMLSFVASPTAEETFLGP